MYRSLFLSAALLSAPAALAQDEVPTSLEGVGRLTIQSGWRMTSNDTLYDGYYSAPGREGLVRGPTSSGGPLAVGSFAYAVTDTVELGVDLFATGERLHLTDQPVLNTMTYGALVGVRFQTVLPDFGPYGLVPFAGILTGPTLAYSAFEGQTPQEIMTQAWAGTVGATMRLSPRWGVTAEYRLSFVRGQVGSVEQKLGSFNGGGSWFALGITYTWPPEPGLGAGRGVGF